MTRNARAFLEANRRSPVISGAVIGSGGKGGYYTLANGQSFTLNVRECEQVGLPWWEGQPKPASILS